MMKVKHLAHKSLRHMGTPADNSNENTMTGAISNGKIVSDNSFKISGSGVSSLASNKVPINIKTNNKSKFDGLVKTIF